LIHKLMDDGYRREMMMTIRETISHRAEKMK